VSYRHSEPPLSGAGNLFEISLRVFMEGPLSIGKEFHGWPFLGGALEGLRGQNTGDTKWARCQGLFKVS